MGTGNHKPDKCKQIQCFEFRTKLDIIPHPVKYARPEKVVSAVMQEVSPESELSRSSEPPGPLIPPGGHDSSKEHLHGDNTQSITLPVLQKQLCKMFCTVYFVSLCYDFVCMRSNYQAWSSERFKAKCPPQALPELYIPQPQALQQ